jgi:pyruvate/2-oxoglutarate dehydrogenase complex dihydrolipoamide dehydrogenase (E3) component
MPQATNYDVIVIGTSQGGRFLPMTFAKAGRKVAVIERGHLGGVCVNFGCTPTKTMVASARVAYLARRSAEYGVRTGPVSVDCRPCANANKVWSRALVITSRAGLRQCKGSIWIY